MPRVAFCCLLLALAGPLASAQKNLGPGSPGTGGVFPRLSSAKPYAGSNSFSVDLDFGLGGASGLLVISPDATSINIGGFPIYVDLNTALTPYLPFVLSGPSGVAGAGSFSLPLPLGGLSGPSFAGLTFTFQAAIFEPSQLVVSNGLTVSVQMEPSLTVASSVAGSADPFVIVDPTLGTSLFQGLAAETNNVNGVAFADDGRTLYVLASGTSIYKRDMTAPLPPVWTPVLAIVNAVGVSAGNLQLDPCRKLLWFTGNLGSGYELHALDVNPSSPSFEQVLYSTNSVGTNLVGTWALSPSGRMVCIPDLLNGGIRVWDTDPASPNFLQNVPLWQQPIPIPLTTSQIPTSPGGAGLWVNNAVAFSPDEDSIFVLRQGAAVTPGEIAVYSFSQLGWIDFDLGTVSTDNLGAFSSPPLTLGSAPTSLSVGPNAESLFVSGFGGTGFAGRIDLPLAPASATYTPVTSFSVANAWRSSINPDGDRVAIASGSPFTLRVLDLASLNVLFSVPLLMSDATNIVWH